ncbi:hypothetical protein M103_3239 [Bacteroides fragilis str. 1007-1-F |nr:hypothetical protein M103_3239 [Bacteroides fragilis str. 1007-1-F \
MLVYIKKGLSLQVAKIQLSVEVDERIGEEVNFFLTET